MRILLSLALATTMVISAFAESPLRSAPENQTQTPKGSASAENAVCPVTGDKIGSMGKPAMVDYQGKKIALCCKMCLNSFQTAPAKYTALAEKKTSHNWGHGVH